jgi:hypothetical protein
MQTPISITPQLSPLFGDTCAVESLAA